ncbi:MAG: ester cyclase [Bacteroidota bacterium]|jgi:predicted ester cyclase
MKKTHLQFVGVIPLTALLFTFVGCQNQNEKVQLEKFKATAKIQDQNRELVREVFGAIDNRNFEKLKEILSDDFCLNTPGSPQPWKRDDLFKGIENFYASFPDWTHTINDVVTEGDKVVVKLTGRGTQKAVYENILPAGANVTQSAVHIMTLINGKVKEWWVLEDNLGFMTQLGMELKPTKSKK